VIALEATGPVQSGMPHFGKLKGWPGEVYRCHLNKGAPPMWPSGARKRTL